MAQSTTKQVVSATPTVPAGHGNGAGVSARSLVGATITARSVGVGGAQEGGGRMARRGGGRTGSTSRWLGDIQPTPMSPPVLDHPLPLAAAAAAPAGGHGPLSAIHGDGGRAACLGRWLEERAGCHTRWLGLILRGGWLVARLTIRGWVFVGESPGEGRILSDRVRMRARAASLEDEEDPPAPTALAACPGWCARPQRPKTVRPAP